jgi:hypothetical protein
VGFFILDAMRITENLQQKKYLFAPSFEFAARLPKIKGSLQFYPPELANRFFLIQ